MPIILFAELGFHWSSGWLKELATQNISWKFSTFETFQEFKGTLKEGLCK
jgi:hypothetical protein